MFLEELSKREATIFVNLVKHLSTVDEIFSSKEKALVEEYLEELSLSQSELEIVSFEDCINILKASSSRIQNIIYFELIGLALIDGVYSEEEVDLLGNLSKAFGITPDKEASYLGFFKQVKDLYEITVVDYENKVTELKELALNLLPRE